MKAAVVSSSTGCWRSLTARLWRQSSSSVMCRQTSITPSQRHKQQQQQRVRRVGSVARHRRQWTCWYLGVCAHRLTVCDTVAMLVPRRWVVVTSALEFETSSVVCRVYMVVWVKVKVKVCCVRTPMTCVWYVSLRRWVLRLWSSCAVVTRSTLTVVTQRYSAAGPDHESHLRSCCVHCASETCLTRPSMTSWHHSLLWGTTSNARLWWGSTMKDWGVSTLTSHWPAVNQPTTQWLCWRWTATRTTCVTSVTRRTMAARHAVNRRVVRPDVLPSVTTTTHQSWSVARVLMCPELRCVCATAPTSLSTNAATAARWPSFSASAQPTSVLRAMTTSSEWRHWHARSFHDVQPDHGWRSWPETNVHFMSSIQRLVRSLHSAVASVAMHTRSDITTLHL